MIGRLYEWIWQHTTNEPWTNIIRREQKGFPILFMLIFLGGGILLVKLVGRNWWQIVIGILFGILMGHFWW